MGVKMRNKQGTVNKFVFNISLWWLETVDMILETMPLKLINKQKCFSFWCR